MIRKRAKASKKDRKRILDILFVQNYYEPAFGIMYISAFLKQHGFTTDVVIGTKEHIINKTIEKKPRVIGFYCTTGFHHKNIATAKEIKKRLGDEILTIFGGPHPTLVPSMIESEGVDIICRGEGEHANLELMQSLRAGNDYIEIKNLTVKKNGKIYGNEIRPLCNVDTLPHPDREIYRNIGYIYRKKIQEVMIGRGCPFNCTFCSSHAFRELYRGKGSYVRLRPIPNIMEELEAVKRCYDPSCFFFHDETFFLKKDYCRELLNIYKEKIGLPFTCITRADLITEDLVKLLKKTGCYYTAFGIESGNERRRNTLMKKNISDEDILNCATLLHKYKIPFATFNMVGLPNETLRDVWDTVDMNVQVKPGWAWFSSYQTLPGTELARYALDQGYTNSADVAESDASFHESSIILRNHPEGKKILRLKNNANLVVKVRLSKILLKNVILNLPLDELYGWINKFFYFIFFYSKILKLNFFRAIYSMFFIRHHFKEFK